ncbi:MAG: hypothetical protein WB789_08810 [Thermoplasmata archaeon]
MAAGGAADGWPDFTFSAHLQFWARPPRIFGAFAVVVPQFTRFPRRLPETVDVCPLRNDLKHWRLKVARYRAPFQILHGRPLVEGILLRTGRTYRDFKGHRRRFPAK